MHACFENAIQDNKSINSLLKPIKRFRFTHLLLTIVGAGGILQFILAIFTP